MLGIPTAYLGHAAGLATSVLWTGTSLAFTAAARRLGPTVVNTTRIAMAVVLLGLAHRVLEGTWIPQAHGRQVLYLALSGLVGLTIGDQALFTAYMQIGPRLAMLIMTVAPLLAGLFGFVVLGETLVPLAWVGIALTVGGVAWVVLERPQETPAIAKPHATTEAPGRPATAGTAGPRLTSEVPGRPAITETSGARRTPDVLGRHRGRGVFLAFVAGACQAGGLLLSKQGIGHGWLPESEYLRPQTATLLRMSFALAGLLPVAGMYYARERRQRQAGILPARTGGLGLGLLLTFCGAVFGPFLGVWMSLEAADKVPLGVAQTLCSLPPIFILPFSRLVYRERISVRAVLGAILAVAGVAVLFLAGPLQSLIATGAR